ncbi:nucleotide-binding protein [Paenibacillus sp. HGH0039]|uniref:nucleotide-binding protein n=1 Tax=Paenibacillus sp. HGH0039 TaxID=1078505 RepID=UPI00034E509E|nr:AAA family ATPase [Paenibacillus sp. HGH0039]EPD80458.1 hypothetical protein HMPREF1207_05673 [Paenibacillus sp. HGH0039]
MVVLVVIDQDSPRSSRTAEVLGNYGAKVYEALNRQQTDTVMAREGRIDAIFTVPEMGPERISKIKSSYNCPVFIVGEISPKEIPDLRKAGADDLLITVDPLPANFFEKFGLSVGQEVAATPEDQVPKFLDRSNRHAESGFSEEVIPSYKPARPQSDFSLNVQTEPNPETYQRMPQSPPSKHAIGAGLTGRGRGHAPEEFNPNYDHEKHDQEWQHAERESAREESMYFATPGKQLNKVILIGSVKGGEGKSTLTAQLGSLLGRKGFSPLGIDCDANGNLARLIGEKSIHSTTEFGVDKSRNPQQLESMLVNYRKVKEFRVLPSSIDGFDPITWGVVKPCIDSFMPLYPLMLLDLSEGYTPTFDQVAQHYATDILILTSPDVHRLERTVAMGKKLLGRGINPKNVTFVVNKVKKESDYQTIRSPLIKEGFNVVYLPFHQELADATTLDFKPIVLSDPKSNYAKSFRKLVTEVLKIKMTSGEQEMDIEKKPAGKKKKKKKKQGFNFDQLLTMLRLRKE